jgi:dihydroxyacetone kinase
MRKINAEDVKGMFKEISSTMDENKDYLVELDSKAGDGDLGISMSSGFKAVVQSHVMETDNIKKILMNAGMTINEASPSSLGTILFMGIMGGIKKIGNLDEMGAVEIGEFFKAAAEAVMEKTGSKPGEKTILDSVIPGAEALIGYDGDDLEEAFEIAAKAAAEGAESTKEMMAVHGRAAYYREKSIGNQDGGATVGTLIFKSLHEYVKKSS